MNNKDIKTDVVILGAGPGGYVAALELAQKGKSVILIEKEEVGGICLHSGCIPSKTLINVAKKYDSVKQYDKLGIEIGNNIKLNFNNTQKYKEAVIEQLTNGIKKLLKMHKISLIYGEAKFKNNESVLVTTNDEMLIINFDYCIIATGSRPIELPSLAFTNRVITSTELLNIAEIPKKLVVVGGGYIGIELSQVFAKFGTQIEIIETTDSILSGFEARTISLIKRNLKKYNIKVHTKALAKSVIEENSKATIKYVHNEIEHSTEADYVVVTIGRRPNTDNIGLNNTDIKTNEKGLIIVDEQGRTNKSNIYAIGDVIAGPALAHKASYDAKKVANIIIGEADVLDYTTMPFVVFSDPEIALVGMTENQAKETGIETVVGRATYGANGRAVTLGETEGTINLVANYESGMIIGAQIVGTEASNLIAELSLAINQKATLQDIADTIHAHPTLSETIQEAAESAMKMMGV